MKRPKESILYSYRGHIERGSSYTWHAGYSATGANGGVLYPWMTKRECQRDAKSQGKRAEFNHERS